MKYTIALLSAAVLAAAQPHRHAHHAHHHERRNPTPATDVVSVPGPTVVMYELNGKTISEDDVQEGIKNGTLVWANGEEGFVPSYASSVSSTASFSAVATSTFASSTSTVAPSTTSVEVASSSAAASSTSSAAAASSSSSSSDDSSDSSSGTGVDRSFPDGEIDCSEFPSEYGAVSVDWVGLGGWTGIQQPGSSDGGFSDITTVTSSTCSDGNCCTDGSYCSYACPAGYQKSQWPSMQGSTGQSVGGLLCKNGKLYKTGDLSDSLCMTGTDKVTVLVKNEMSETASVCRTDYPGTESETVPLAAKPGSTQNLTCPDADNYYNWKGSATSAQYYVNPSGVGVEDACQWGSSSNPWGNFAPLNLGVGYSAGAAWLSIFQNSPTTNTKLDFAVEIQGDNLSGSCKYSNGQYCSGDDYSDCSSTTGCTVSLTSGTATFVFTSS
ncbi:Sperm-associated antigen 4 protein [Zalaria obscura]|uniref:Sperm-associated antigen 4 protein n=1 Tax=Zalaria obscura TaxID=2024903 RepID=A0ACC3SIM3_9PEZI